MPDRYHVGQTNLRVEIETNLDCSANSALLVKFKKPNGNKGSWSASIGTDADTSKIYYDIASARDLDMHGDWYFWAHVTFSDGTIGIGAAVKQEIREEGDG